MAFKAHLTTYTQYIMKNIRFLLCLLTLGFTGLLAAQTMTVEERNERIRERWNRSLVDNENYRFNKQPNFPNFSPENEDYAKKQTQFKPN